MTPAVEKAMEITVGIGTRHSERLRESWFSSHPRFCLALAHMYKRIARSDGYQKANYELINVCQNRLLIAGTGIRVGVSDSELLSYSEGVTKTCVEAFMFFDKAESFEGLVQFVCDMCQKHGVENPMAKSKDCLRQLTLAKRLVNVRWWHRKLRVLNRRGMEQFAREQGLVSRHKKIYCSDYAMASRLEQKSRNQNILSGLVVENQHGYQIDLLDAVESSVANPVNRRNELMARIAGFEHIAKGLDYVGMFITMTCPSVYHCVTGKGYRNSRYNYSDPREAQRYLSDTWAKIRAAWQREDIRPFGFRVAEPHHDGTPHWHMLLFVSRDQYVLADSIARNYATERYADELTSGNALKARYYCKKMDLATDSAAGYIAKYVSKNIDSFGVDVDYEDGNCAKSNARRVDAWASCWGIRQFQQIGGASVTVWREVRKGITQGAFDLQDIESDVLEKVKQAAFAGDWAAFVDAMGGVLVPRSEHAIQAWKVLSDKKNDYGEFVDRIRGVLMRRSAAVIETRLFEWTIKKATRSGASWSCNNNCTDESKKSPPDDKQQFKENINVWMAQMRNNKQQNNEVFYGR